MYFANCLSGQTQSREEDIGGADPTLVSARVHLSKHSSSCETWPNRNGLVRRPRDTAAFILLADPTQPWTKAFPERATGLGQSIFSLHFRARKKKKKISQANKDIWPWLVRALFRELDGEVTEKGNPQVKWVTFLWVPTLLPAGKEKCLGEGREMGKQQPTALGAYCSR